MRSIIYIIMFACATLFASCSQQREVKGVVEDFLESSLKEPSTLRSLSVVRLDSTSAVGDSAIMRLRKSAESREAFKRQLTYANPEGKRKLIVARVEYVAGDSTHTATFYLNHERNGVVAFMERGE